jgi:hypothetical protein
VAHLALAALDRTVSEFRVRLLESGLRLGGAAAVAPLPAAVGTGSAIARGMTAALLLAASGCGRDAPVGEDGPDLSGARVALGANFVGGQARGLRALLHPDLIVQPPQPDAASGGEAAAAYLERLARESVLGRSELLPGSLAREGGFLLERGVWYLESGERILASRYMIRWRESADGWKVVLWRWTVFR